MKKGFIAVKYCSSAAWRIRTEKWKSIHMCPCHLSMVFHVYQFSVFLELLGYLYLLLCTPAVLLFLCILTSVLTLLSLLTYGDLICFIHFYLSLGEELKWLELLYYYYYISLSKYWESVNLSVRWVFYSVNMWNWPGWEFIHNCVEETFLRERKNGLLIRQAA